MIGPVRPPPWDDDDVKGCSGWPWRDIDGRMTDPKSQSDKFKEAARELGCDEDEVRWDERLRKVAKPKPADKRDTP